MKIAFESYDPVTGRTGKIRMLTFNYQVRIPVGEERKV